MIGASMWIHAPFIITMILVLILAFSLVISAINAWRLENEDRGRAPRFIDYRIKPGAEK